MFERHREVRMLEWICPVKPESHQGAAEGPQWTLPSNPISTAGPDGIALVKLRSSPWVHGVWPLVQQMQSFPFQSRTAETICIHLEGMAVHI